MIKNNKIFIITAIALLVPFTIFTVLLVRLNNKAVDEDIRLMFSLRDVNGITVYDEKYYHVYNGGKHLPTGTAKATEEIQEIQSTEEIPEVRSDYVYVEAPKNAKDYSIQVIKAQGVKTEIYQSDNYVLHDVRDIPWNTKTHMRYQYLGYQSWNRQGHLSRQHNAYTGKYGIRMIDGRCLIALGSRFSTTIGTYIDVILEDGTVIPCILGDAKSDAHTDETHTYQKWDHSILEFVIDSENADYSDFKAKYPNVNGNFSNVGELSSKVAYIKVYDKVYDIDMTDISGDHN